MDLTDILDPLNEPQRLAVCAPAGNLLVLAGAGSGKTRVLTHRIAWLVRIGEASTYGILAVTFTNKAAREMRQRIEAILAAPLSGMWVGTFHGIAHRLLRAHWREANLPESFQIIDSDDQYRLIRRALRELHLDEASWPPKLMQWTINQHKDRGERSAHIDPMNDAQRETFIQIYQHYETLCQRNGLLDFAEILLRAHELWLHHPDLCNHYRQRFRHILVDEFQDTNTIQYAWIRTLAGEENHTFVVGDDDQSIYGWRGAQVGNLQLFQQQFAPVTLIRLEQNYRSTGNILAAANALIGQNEGRLGKNLWTADAAGNPIQLYRAFNELDEADFISERIAAWCARGRPRQSCAILYRSNAQSRVLEAALLQRGIPYRVYGGLRFFERAEIKDVLAYLRLCQNRDDDPSFERIINTPTRGIGSRTLEIIRETAQHQGVSHWAAMLELIAQQQLPARAQAALQQFAQLITEMSHRMAENSDSEAPVALDECVDQIITLSKLGEFYQKEGLEKGETRIENMQELISAARQFEQGNGTIEEISEDELTISTLSAFLAHATLEAGEGQADVWEDAVQLMTLHSAKGLEFPLVFMSGVEEGLFPNKMSLEEPGRLEEERRLCYVGITRAMEQLYLSYAEIRRLYGKENYARPSRFIDEIPESLLERVRAEQPTFSGKPLRTTPAPMLEDSSIPFHIGQQVHHAKFGEGTIVHSEGSGAQARLQINFAEVGMKWLVIAYAKLTPV
ncbi:MAG: DNA helicase II [Gammaproteobacteria bacterium]|nr:DNA helicase II [Gammaproteobacteria bacterium]